MNKAEVFKRIGILCELAMREHDSRLLTQHLTEIEQLVEAYRTHVQFENPPPLHTEVDEDNN